MTPTKTIIATTAIASLLSSFGTEATLAADVSTGLTMKPLYGVSFDVGSKHAVGYFTSEKGECKLIVTMADEPNWDDEVPAFTATRFEASVPPGKATRLRSGDGNAIEFKCQTGAQAMSVHGAKQLAAGGVD